MTVNVDPKFPIKDKIENILILRTGTVKHTFDVVKELKSIYPDCKVTLLTQDDSKRLFDDPNWIDERITAKKVGDYSFKISLYLIKKIREKKYDLTVILLRTTSSNRDIRANFLNSIIKSKYKLSNNFRHQWSEIGLTSPIINLFTIAFSVFWAGLKYFSRPFSKTLKLCFCDFPLNLYSYSWYLARLISLEIMDKSKIPEINKPEISSYNWKLKETLKAFKKIKKGKVEQYNEMEIYNLAISLVAYNRFKYVIEIFSLFKKRFKEDDPITLCSMNYYKAYAYYHTRQHNYAKVALKNATEALLKVDDPVIKLSWNNKIEKLSTDNIYQKLNFPIDSFMYKFGLDESYNIWIHTLKTIKIITKRRKIAHFGRDHTLKKGYREKNRKVNDKEYNNMKFYLTSNPVGLSICLTGKCNLNCGKCVRNTPLAIKQRSSWEKDISPEILDKLRTFFPGLYGVRLTSAYGEPLLYPDFKDIIKELYDSGVRVGTFNTNGILLKPDIAQFLVDHPIVDSFAVSLDASTEETYKKLQGKPFLRIIENIKYYMSISNNYPNLNLYFIVSKSNVNEICDYIKMAHEFGIKNVLMDYMNYGEDYFKINIPMSDGHVFRYKEEYLGNKFVSDIREDALELGKKFGINLMGNFFQEYYIEDKVANGNIPICSLPWRNLSVETDGGVRNCCWQNENLTNINDCETIDDLWNNEKQIKVRNMIKKNKLDDICYSTTCPVVSSGVKINWLFQ